MNTLHKINLTIALMLTTNVVLANDVSSDMSEAQGIKNSIRKIDSTKRLPTGSFSLVTADGKNYLISENGRFAIPSPVIYDTWNMTKITTVSEASDVDKLDLAKLGLNNPENITIYETGSKGKPVVTVFVDPRCPHCSAVTKQIPALESKYQFKIIPVPILGEDSGRIVKNMHCANDKKLALSSIISGQYKNLPVATPECDINKITKTIVATSLLGIKGVPFTVMPNNKTFPGRIDDLAKVVDANLK